MRAAEGFAAGVLASILWLAFMGAAAAVQPGEMLADKAMEARARRISTEIRCLVCQNQSIDDSDAPLAHDLRVLVRDRLRAGDSDGQVRDFIVDRYGAFVLLRPPMTAQTFLLWFGPALLVGAAIMGLFLARRRSAIGPPALTAEEEAGIAALLAEEGKEPPSRRSAARPG